MRISESFWVNYIETLAKIDSTAAEKMKEFLKGYNSAEDGGQKLIDVAYMLATRYGEAAAELACEMYDEIAAESGMVLPPAEPAATATYEETAKAINGTLKTFLNPDQPAVTVGRLVKQAGQDTTLKNALRDGAEFAWIPHGDTCAFCIALASRGWQVMSKKALKNGHAEHIHGNCDCSYAVRFDDSQYAGYDPDQYLKMYEDADGRSSKDKINSMRRMKYAQDPEAIRAQKREAYTLRQQALDLQSIVSDGRIKKGAASFGAGERVYYDENADYTINIQEYSDEINRQLSESARKVAEQGSKDSWEYAAVIDLNTGKEEQFGTSKDFRSVNSYYEFLKNHPNGRYAMVHNHNIVSGLSLEDIQEISMWTNLECITAVQNNGPTYTVVSNGVKSKEYLPWEFESVGSEYSDLVKREHAMVQAAVKKYTTGEIR